MAKKVVDDQARQRRRPTKSGQVLSERFIVETALRLLNDDQGGDGLTARRLGRALGADPSTVYRYFRNMDELALAIADELTRRATAKWNPTGDWQADLRSWGLSAYAVYLEYPRATVLSSPRVSGRPAEMAAADKVLGLFLSAGFTADAAFKAYTLFVSQLLGYSTYSSLRRSLPKEGKAANQSTMREAYGTLAVDDYPNIAATARQMATLPQLEHYPLALELMLTGLSAALRNARTHSSKMTTHAP